MSHSQAAAWPIGTGGFLRRLRGVAGNVRLTVIVCVVLICGSFASAALIQMRLDRAHALAQAQMFAQRRAQEIATDLSSSFERDAAIGAAFATAGTSAETSAALSEAGGAALKNIAVLDAYGGLHSEMTGAPRGLLPLSSETLAAARKGRTIIAARDGRSIALLFPVQGRIVAVQIDAALLLAPAAMSDVLLATPSGGILALGPGWSEIPGHAAAALDGTQASRIVRQHDGARLLSLQRVNGWPLVAGASLRVEDALGAWYSALPLYFFFILGPAFAGAALAVVFVRVFERQAKAWAAVKALRSTHPDEARLLVRLADAERRAVEAERAKARFVAHVSHELRTPLNAIIGFAEVIERSEFGAPGHPKYAEYARDIGAAGRELHAKIGAVLEYASSSAPREPPGTVPGTVDVGLVLRAVVNERRNSASERRLKLAVSAPESALVRGDDGTLSRILAHLLDNALAYTPSGGTVRVALGGDERGFVIGIRDTGLGFSAEEKSLAGRPFQRFPRPGSRGGMGLGMATAMALARRIDAAIRLSSLGGEGTLVELRLSAAPGQPLG